MNDVRSGKLDPKTALSLAQLLGLQLRAIEVLELEWYAQRYRKQSAEARQGSIDGNLVAPLDSHDVPGQVGKAEAEDGSSPTDNPSDSDPEQSD